MKINFTQLKHIDNNMFEGITEYQAKYLLRTKSCEEYPKEGLYVLDYETSRKVNVLSFPSGKSYDVTDMIKI